jgi:hypothetical protein
MIDLPDPLTPESCDLRNFAYMPLDVVRLRDSEIAGGDHSGFHAAVLLWCASWHQIPAASLPNDDAKIARLAGYGRDVRNWKRARSKGAMYGWILCSDDRWYHPVVAEKALEAWSSKTAQTAKTEAARAARQEAKATSTRPPLDLHSESTRSGGAAKSISTQGQLDVEAPLENTQIIENTQNDMSVTDDHVATVTNSNGEERIGKDKERTPLPPKPGGVRDDPAFQKFYKSYPRHTAPDDAFKAWQQMIRAGAKPSEIMAGLARFQFGSEAKYIPYPASWLRAGNWKSEPTTQSALSGWNVGTGNPDDARSEQMTGTW